MGAFTCICTAVHSIYNTAVRLLKIIAWQQDVAAITIKCNEICRSALLGYRAHFGMTWHDTLCILYAYG